MTFTPVGACRSCGDTALFDVLDLGEQPLANALRQPGDTSPEVRYPLEVVGCPSCSLVQLSGTVDPAELFDHYHYFSSYSTTMLEAMASLAKRLVAERDLDERSLVVEIASNDGYLLTHYVQHGVPVLGIDPARNVAETAIARGVPTEVAYFGEAVGTRVRDERGPAAVIHANNVLAHVPDVNDVVAGVAALLADDGVAVIETPHLVRMLDGCEFDTIYHEHVFYYSLTALQHLFERHGLLVCAVEELAVHGGSLRVFVRHAPGVTDESVARILRREDELGVAAPACYQGFATRVEALSASLLAELRRRREAGERLAGYGAAAKGTVLLNHVGIGTELLDFVVDRNPDKQGLEVPGVHIPIRDPAALLAERPDAVLLLTWNFADEIVAQQRAYLDAGGVFLVPVPELVERRR